MLKKFLFALAISMFLLLLSFFGSLGYNVHAIKEVSFKPYSQLGYADAVIFCDIVYNPILYPFYWIVGKGRLVGNFSVMYIPEGYKPGEFGGPIWGVKPEERYDTYINILISWGTISNLIILFIINLIIEFVFERLMYLILLLGIFGFIFWELYGIIIGVLIGCIFTLVFKIKPRNFIRRWIQFMFE